MCGIAGVAGIEDGQCGVQAMTCSMAHRGPDGEGFWHEDRLFFGHRRLSVIDLTPAGNQPMTSWDGTVVLIFNGEVYNFREIRQELLSKGYVFRSTSDTEVVLYAYKEWGTDSFARLNGMYALALFDKSAGVVRLARDHAGIKPLYYHVDRDRFLFGSELRAFKAYEKNWPENPDWSSYFLSFGFIPFPHTTLSEVYQLPKGHFLTYDLAGNRAREQPSLTPFRRFSFSRLIRSEAEAVGRVRRTLLEAVERHMIADAPLGIFLSGGIDSSLMALIADYQGHRDLQTLSVTFDEAGFSEKPYQEIVLGRMRPHHHKDYRVTREMFDELLDDVLRAMDQPSTDGVNSYFVSKSAHEAGLKAVLSGLGADELFGGYASFRRVKLLEYLERLPAGMRNLSTYAWRDSRARIAYLNLGTPYRDYLVLRGLFSPQLVAQLNGTSLADVDRALSGLTLDGLPSKRDGNLATFLETNVYMENQLLKDSDAMSMWHSLEIRVPFLDPTLMQLLYSIDPSVKFRRFRSKYLVSQAFADLLPAEIVSRRKHGFAFPIGIWLRSNFSRFESMLPETPFTSQIVGGFMAGRVHWTRVWALIVWQHFRMAT